MPFAMWAVSASCAMLVAPSAPAARRWAGGAALAPNRWVGSALMVEQSVPSAVSTPLFSFEGDRASREAALSAFERIDDVIMGGVSSSRLVLAEDEAGGAIFEGRIREQGGGFCGQRLRLLAEPLDLSSSDGVYLEVDARLARVEARVLKVAVRTRQDRGEVVYQQAFRPSAREARERILLPFDGFRLVRGPRLVPGVPPLSAALANETYQMSIVISKFEVSEDGAALATFEEGPFALRMCVDCMAAQRQRAHQSGMRAKAARAPKWRAHQSSARTKAARAPSMEPVHTRPWRLPRQTALESRNAVSRSGPTRALPPAVPAAVLPRRQRCHAHSRRWSRQRRRRPCLRYSVRSSASCSASSRGGGVRRRSSCAHAAAGLSHAAASRGHGEPRAARARSAPRARRLAGSVEMQPLRRSRCPCARSSVSSCSPRGPSSASGRSLPRRTVAHRPHGRAPHERPMPAQHGHSMGTVRRDRAQGAARREPHAVSRARKPVEPRVENCAHRPEWRDHTDHTRTPRLQKAQGTPRAHTAQVVGSVRASIKPNITPDGRTRP